jgi:hypothetical protein
MVSNLVYSNFSTYSFFILSKKMKFLEVKPMDGGKSGGGHTPQAAFEERLGEVVRERLMADSKSTAFFLECEALAHKVGSSRRD